MPNVLLKRCGFRGCPRTTRQRYCDEHAPLARRFYDRKRGTTTQRGYDGAWKQLAEQRRQLDAGLCQECLKAGLLRASPLVDHILPIHIRPDWRLEIDNTQVLCTDCHTSKSSEDLARYGGRVRKNLTSEQTLNRYAAQQLARPPRDGEC